MEVGWHAYILIIVQLTTCSGDPNGPQNPDPNAAWEGKLLSLHY